MRLPTSTIKISVANSADPSVSLGFVVDVVTLLRWPGSQVQAVLDEDLHGVETSTASARHVSGTLVVESMSDALSVAGTVDIDWSGECRRCLGEATGVTPMELQEIYERLPVDGETFPLTDDRVDLEPMVRELIFLSLPLAPLCAAECLGPAPSEFPANTADDSLASTEPTGDPRWAALDALVFDEDAE